MSPALWDRFDDLARVDAAATTGVGTPEVAVQTDAIVAAAVELIAQLASDGLVAATLIDQARAPDADELRRLWAGVVPLYRDFATSSHLVALQESAGMSRRQLSRDLGRLLLHYGLLGDVFRDASRVLRLRAATLLLSAPDTTATQVAAMVGYSSLDAMGRAFRDAKLGAPSAVQQAVRLPV